MANERKGVDTEKLRAWMTLREMGPKHLAALLGVSEVTARNIMAGKHRPHPSKGRILVDASEGALTMADLYPFTKYVYTPKKGAA